MSVISFPLNRFLAAIAPPVAAIVLVTFANPSRRFVLSWDGQKEIELRAEDAHTICLRSIRSFSRGQCERFVINRSFVPTDCFSSLRGILSSKFIRLFFKKYKNRHASRCIRIVTKLSVENYFRIFIQHKNLCSLRFCTVFISE